jgi:hypothetical protein
MQRTYNKYKTFEWRVLLVCDKSNLLLYEQLMLDSFKPTLNLSGLAGRVEWTPTRINGMRAKKMGNQVWLGRKHSAETKAKMRIAAMGKPGTMLGRKHSLATIAKRRAMPRPKEFLQMQTSAARRKSWKSPEYRAKVIAGLKRYYAKRREGVSVT